MARQQEIFFAPPMPRRRTRPLILIARTLEQGIAQRTALGLHPSDIRLLITERNPSEQRCADLEVPELDTLWCAGAWLGRHAHAIACALEDADRKFRARRRPAHHGPRPAAAGAIASL